MSNRFLVSYILNNDPKSSEVSSDQESLTPGEAMALLSKQDSSLETGQATDVRVQKVLDRDADRNEPGHNLQHGDL
ncbi:hypothetical protein [Pseudomonas sp.]|jgi:hypothetical protein|uniref:hypothetical protein n=1 Tax=Pseudomonas sp. TaxID=306 RepID=UPI00272BCCC3|nr:hypothetical protein [Pseudomonas sp.]